LNRTPKYLVVYRRFADAMDQMASDTLERAQEGMALWIPEPRSFTFLWPAPRFPWGPAASLRGDSIGIRVRYPSWSRRRVR
jgi:hypothetical protein